MEVEGVGGLCVAKVEPLTPLTVWEVEKTLLRYGCIPAEVGSG